MAFRVEVTPQAEQDADTILEWLLSQHAGETGLRWFLRLREAIDSLAEMPKCLREACHHVLLSTFLIEYLA